MIHLDQLTVAKPCRQDWEQMTGTDQVRFCSECKLNVYNISEMSRPEAERLIAEKEGRLCVRFYRRSDGTLLTRDCPVGVRAFYRRFALAASWIAGMALNFGAGSARAEDKKPQQTGRSAAQVLPPTQGVPPMAMGIIQAPQFQHKGGRKAAPVKPAPPKGHRKADQNPPHMIMGDSTAPSAHRDTNLQVVVGSLLSTRIPENSRQK